MRFDNVTYEASYGTFKQLPKSTQPEVCFSGRSNVGKSSLINKILNRKQLARVSSQPGKTITINFYDVDGKLFLVDLPGYGFAKRKPEEREIWSRLTDGYFTDNKNADRIRLVIQLIDSRVGPTADDEMMLNYLSETETPFIVVATKSDKLNATERKKAEELFRSHPQIPTDVPVLFYSSLKGEGREALWKQISAFTDVRI